MDEIDLETLRHLQVNARLSLSELGRLVHLSRSAVSDRVRKLEDHGVIQGYGARIDTAKLELPLPAFVRLRPESSDSRALPQLIEGIPEIVECDHVTGGDCYIFTLAARSMKHMKSLTKRVKSRPRERGDTLLWSHRHRSRWPRVG